MQILSLLTALTISVILASQAMSTWSTPRDASIANQDVALLRSAIREHMTYAVTHQQPTTMTLPDTVLVTQVRSFSGHHLEAYPDGSVSPGQVRLCGRQVDWVLTVSSLGRTRLSREPSNR